MTARLIELQPDAALQSRLAVNVGDVLLVAAFGVLVDSGGEAIEVVGPLAPGMVGTSGDVLSPAGAPNTLLIVARKPGRSVLAFKVGDPWHAPQTASLDLEIRP